MMNKQSPHHFRSIAITGASRGLGAALAQELAGDGIVLFLSARDQDNLETVAKTCRTLGAEVHITALDVRDKDATARWVNDAHEKKPLDLMIANAGISGGSHKQDSAGDHVDEAAIWDVNLHGVLNSIMPCVPLMEARGSGHIAIMSSLAGFRGMPDAPAYCASKAAVKNYGEALRASMAPKGVEVSVICPGFVKSDMTAANNFKMPFLMETQKAARIMVRGLTKKRGRIAFPLPMVFAVWLLTVLPDRFVHFLTKKKH